MTSRAPNVFGTVAIPINHVDPRWQLVRNAAAKALTSIPTGASLTTAVHAVDQWVNGVVTYQREMVDTWANPAQTLASRRGDCEDFAILKRAILRAHGVPDELLYLTLLYDAISRNQHAILLVDVATEFLVLDCFNALTLPSAEVMDYLPITTMSGDQCWIHGRRTGTHQP